MRDAGETSPSHSRPDLGVLQAMLDIGMVYAADDRRSNAEQLREEDGFLPGSPDHYQRLAEAVIDLVKAHPVQGPEELAGMLQHIERMSWKAQDRLTDRSEARRQKIMAWAKRRRENPTEFEQFIDRMRGLA